MEQPTHAREPTTTNVAAAHVMEQPTHTREPTTTEQQKMFETICDIVGWDYRTLDAKSKGMVAQTLGIFRKASYTLAELDRFWPEVWACDWRWTKNKQRPTLTQLRQEIGKLRAPDFKANGATSGGEKSWAEKFASQDIPEYILKMQRGEGP